MKTSQKTSKSQAYKEIKNNFEASEQNPSQDKQKPTSNLWSDIEQQFFGYKQSQSERHPFGRESKSEQKEPQKVRRTEIIFNYQEKQEQVKVSQEIESLMKQVKQELELLKTQDKALSHDISKLTVEGVPQKAGIYHLRFLEFVIKLLWLLRQKVSESRMWLQISFEKKQQKKFWHLAKKKGTKFSMSKELSQSNLPG